MRLRTPFAATTALEGRGAVFVYKVQLAGGSFGWYLEHELEGLGRQEDHHAPPSAFARGASFAMSRREVAAIAPADSPMPDDLAGRLATVLCNDCQQRTTAAFHVIGIKCGDCGSYNTRRV